MSPFPESLPDPTRESLPGSTEHHAAAFLNQLGAGQ
jgi:hypothetical protein